MRTIDINCDMGEGFGVYKLGDDEAMMSIVTSANIACGFHAGDPLVMHRTLAAAAANGVNAGAHPSFLDLWGFGRRRILDESPEDIAKQITYQIGALGALAASQGIKLAHVKTHGSLGNMAAEDPALAAAITRAIAALDSNLSFIVMPAMATEKAAINAGVKPIREIYADRAYADTGNLLSRKLAGAVIHDPDLAADRVLRMIEAEAVICESGKRIPGRIDSVCVHGDSPDAVSMAGRLRERLEQAGYTVAPPSKVDKSS
ncbi:5-oxoprolinase subunit PxpA [Mesorhizobium sp. WSM4887]|uniref:LamB/YcsF family protein n=1 Tax=Mesorhizobium sp. WSM4887 TaxID=3038543 RepID=UPI00241769F8|nr:5-oxoprolinase subunit PxpA [Mesorhizobium sp. WSM4887]MDG4889802.1 LamB/YcsF family protein [Mesorhizobium sp. WSM4887]